MHGLRQYHSQPLKPLNKKARKGFTSDGSTSQHQNLLINLSTLRKSMLFTEMSNRYNIIHEIFLLKKLNPNPNQPLTSMLPNSHHQLHT